MTEEVKVEAPKIVVEQAGKQEVVDKAKLTELQNDPKVKVTLDETKSSVTEKVYVKKDLLVEG